MFETSGVPGRSAGASTGPAPFVAAGPAVSERPAAVMSTSELRSWVCALGCPDRTLADAERIEQLRLLEELKSAASAAQAQLTVDFVASQRAEQKAAGLPARRIGQGLPAQVALARRESPARGSRLVGLAQALLGELPETFAALRAGLISEWRATLVARETACLDPDLRRAADTELAPRLPDLGDAQTAAAAADIAYHLDPQAFLARSSRAAKDRRVTLRPAPDTMTRLTALLPVGQGVAAYAALLREADRLRAAGDPRTRGQIMADLTVELLTGQATAGDTPIEIHLVMTDHTLFGHDPENISPEPSDAGSGRPDAASSENEREGAYADDGEGVDDGGGEGVDDGGGEGVDGTMSAPTRPSDEPAFLLGLGPIPAPLARELIRDRAGTVWIRRLYTRPRDNTLIGMDSRRRIFPRALRQLIVLRDQYCRTPWCSAPIRHIDHVTPVADGGPTAESNGQGLCEACNYAKQAPHWQTRPAAERGAGHEVITRTPTGHVYRSHPPPLPGSRQPAPGRAWTHRPPDISHLELRLDEWLHAA